MKAATNDELIALYPLRLTPRVLPVFLHAGGPKVYRLLRVHMARDRGIEDDLRQEGQIGLWIATQKWDPTRGTFRSCAEWWARARIARASAGARASDAGVTTGAYTVARARGENTAATMQVMVRLDAAFDNTPEETWSPMRRESMDSAVFSTGDGDAAQAEARATLANVLDVPLSQREITMLRDLAMDEATHEPDRTRQATDLYRKALVHRLSGVCTARHPHFEVRPCSMCREVKPNSAFRLSPHGKPKSQCIECRKVIDRRRSKKHTSTVAQVSA